MKDVLRIDLLTIVLEEAFGMQEHYARKIAHGGVLGVSPEPRFRKADQEAFDAADHIVDRLEARCSKIEG